MSEIIWLQSTTSTNDDAKTFADQAQQAAESWIGAAQQTAGRGRGTRTWQSPQGNLYASWVGTLDCPLAEASQLSFVASLAVADSVKHYMPEARISLKWPNDVLLEGKKFCGILLEAKSLSNLWLIIGIGVNLMTAPAASKETIYPATALGLDISPKVFLEQLAASFDKLKNLWQTKGFSEIHRRWLAQAHGLGEEIKVRLPKTELIGTFEKLNARGALELMTPQGKQTIEAGDVFFE